MENRVNKKTPDNIKKVSAILNRHISAILSLFER